MTKEIGTLKKWKDLTSEEKGALLLAAHEGKKIEWSSTDGSNTWCDGKWRHCSAVGKFPEFAYRVKPEPVVETRDLYYYESDESYTLTKLGTIDLIDGEPQWDTLMDGSLWMTWG